MKKKSPKKKITLPEISENKVNERPSEYVNIHETASGIPESIAEDIVDAINDAREQREEENDNASIREDKAALKRLLITAAFSIILFWVLSHAGVILHYFGRAIDVVSPLIIGGCIAFVINLVLIPVERLWEYLFGKIKSRKLYARLARFRRPVCLIVATLVLLGFVCGIFFIIIPEIGDTVRMLIDRTPDFVASAQSKLTELYEFLEQYNIVLPEIKLDTEKVIEFLNSFLNDKGGEVINTTVGVTTSIFKSIFNTALAFVFAFYVLAQKEKLCVKTKKAIYAVTRESRADNIIEIATLSNSTFTKFITGQFTEAIIIGVLCWLGMMILRLPYATVISVIIGVTALLPIFGAFIGAAAGFVLILALDFWKAIWFLVFIIVLQQIESNLIYPRVVGKSIGLPGILVLAAVTVGGAMFGLKGIILGVPVCSVIYCIFNAFVTKRIADKGEKIAEKVSKKS